MRIQTLVRSPFGIAVLALIAGRAFGQCPPLTEAIVVRDSGAEMTFSAENSTDVRHVQRLYKVAATDACRVLRSHLAGTLDDPGGFKTANAARLLGSLRAADGETIELLLVNLTFRPDAGIGREPLNGFVCAEALARIGGARVAAAVVTYMAKRRGETELLLCAHVLHQNDSDAITFERFRLATEKAKAEIRGEELDTLLRNIGRVKEWLSDSRFEEDDRYLPK